LIGMAELSHTCLTISDLERSLAFYALLGFEPRRSIGSGPGGSVFCGLSGDADCLQLRLAEDFEPAWTRFGHVALDVEDLETVLDLLAEHGVVPDQPPRLVGSRRVCFVHDPDGYAIELIEEQG
jgi:lactoylglutathione lyase